MKEIRGMQSPYAGVLNQVVLTIVELKLQSARDPYATWDYAEALDAFMIILPIEVKNRIARMLGIEDLPWATDIISDEYEKCMAERDPYTPLPASEAHCLRRARSQLDMLFRLMFNEAHRAGLFIIERSITVRRER